MVRRPGEGRKPIFSFLETVAAEEAAVEAAKRSSTTTGATPAPLINLIAKPLDKYEQKLMGELAKSKEEEEEEAGVEKKALSKLHQNRRINVEIGEEDEAVGGLSRKGAAAAVAAVKRTKVKAQRGDSGGSGHRGGESQDRWRPSGEEDALADSGPTAVKLPRYTAAGDTEFTRAAAETDDRRRYTSSGDMGWRDHSRGERWVVRGILFS